MHELRNGRSRAGFTILEALMGIVLVSIVFAKAYGAVRVANDDTARATNEALLEDQARRVLRQIGYAIMGSNRDSLIPDSIAPLSSEDLRYQVNLGIQDGQVIWSDPEKVALEVTDLNVYWSQNPDAADEQRIVWTNLVTPFLEGELPNGMDDNGNGLIDEQGLSFVVDRNSVTIRLTLERVTPEGQRLTKTVQTTVTCRNVGDGGA